MGRTSVRWRSSGRRPGDGSGAPTPAYGMGGIDPQNPARLSPRPRRLLWTAFIGVAVATVIALISLPYAILSPGPATNTLGEDSSGTALIEVEGAATYPADGALDFTTVSVRGGPDRRINLWDVLAGWLDPDSEVFPVDQLFPRGATSEQIDEENTIAMTGSQREATAVALRSLGYEVPEKYVVVGVTKNTPAAEVIEPGDVVESVDGERVASITAIQDAIRAKSAGEDVALTVRRDDEPLEVTATTTESDGVTVLGIRLNLDFDFPVAVTIHAGDVGGPSAGTMFALAIRDLLTPGSMTGGKQIAGTGTIDEDAQVGPIGGIRQKVVGAREAGAEYFLAPAENCEDLAGPDIPDGLTVVRVATFDEAVDAVEKIAAGEAGLPACA